MRDKCITYNQPVNKIRLFDILIGDIHAEDGCDTIDETVGLTYHEVLEWISEGGDWRFVVTEHQNPKNIFMQGVALQNMNAARRGEEAMVLGFATQEEMDQISDQLHENARNELNI